MLGQAREWRPTLLYGLAHFGKSLFWYSSEILFAYFLTELVGLASSQMGSVLAVGFLVSAAIDVAMGLGLRRRLAAPGAAGRLQLIGAILSSVALASVFAGALTPPDLRYVHAIVAGIGFRVAFALYDIPQNALMSLATLDEASRLRLASTRIFFSGLATLTVAAAVGPMVASSERGGGPTVLLATTAAFATIAIISAAFLARLMPVAAIPTAPSKPLSPWRPPAVFWLLMGLALITTIFTPAFSKLEPYFATYVLGSAGWGAAILSLMAIGILIGQPLWLRLCERARPPSVMIGAALLQIASLAAFWLVGARWPPAAALAALGFGLGNGGVGMIQWAAFSESVARHAPDRTGLAFGLFVASNKIGLAIGGALIATALAATDFRDADSPALVTLMTLIPGVGAALLILNGLVWLRSDRSLRR